MQDAATDCSSGRLSGPSAGGGCNTMAAAGAGCSGCGVACTSNVGGEPRLTVGRRLRAVRISLKT